MRAFAATSLRVRLFGALSGAIFPERHRADARRGAAADFEDAFLFALSVMVPPEHVCARIGGGGGTAAAAAAAAAAGGELRVSKSFLVGGAGGRGDARKTFSPNAPENI